MAEEFEQFTHTCSHNAHSISEILPGTTQCHNGGLTALCINLPSHLSEFIGKYTQTLGHAIDCLLQLQHLTAHVDLNFLHSITACNCLRDLCDGACFIGNVHGLEVSIIV